MYNVEPAITDLIFTEGDSIDIEFSVTDSTGAALVMTGMQIDMDVVNSHGVLIRSFSTAGAAEIVITVNVVNIYSLVGFTDDGRFKYDLQLTDAGEISTIMRGNLIVQKEYTA